jgi:hypothetical protein
MCSEKGDLLMSAGADLKCFVWSATHPFDCLSVYSPGEGGGMFSTLSVGKTMVLTGEWDGMLRVWPLYLSEGADSYFEPYSEESTRRVSMKSEGRSQERKTHSSGEEKNSEPSEKVDRPMLQHKQEPQQVEQPLQPGAPMFVSVTCPPNVQPGAVLNVQHGQVTYQVQVPQGVAPGGTFQFQISAR